MDNSVNSYGKIQAQNNNLQKVQLNIDKTYSLFCALRCMCCGLGELLKTLYDGGFVCTICDNGHLHATSWVKVVHAWKRAFHSSIEQTQMWLLHNK